MNRIVLGNSVNVATPEAIIVIAINSPNLCRGTSVENNNTKNPMATDKTLIDIDLPLILIVRSSEISIFPVFISS